jgi:hypothetical protein
MSPLLRWCSALAVLGAVVGAVAARQEPFPHLQHENLFPECEGCHGGIPTGDAATHYPDPATCGRCHDGQREELIDWRGPSERASNLSFSHSEHTTLVESTDQSATCQTCHGSDGEGKMAVGPARADSCLGCHAHEAPTHVAAGRDCLVCHVPIAEAVQLASARIEAFEQPASHAALDFAGRHAPAPSDAGSCAVCHARESCERCHANAASLTAVASLRPDPRIAALVSSKPPSYPTPADHADLTWDVAHGERAQEAAQGGCANCHTRDSCATCHGEGAGGVIANLPARPAGDDRGVRVTRGATAVHVPGYAERHATDAVASESACGSCHDREQCETCHTAGSTPAFHLPDFLARHGPAAYAADTECASCHNTEVFCRSCHSGTGLAARDRLGIAFHTSNPFWLVGHGVAARQGLENCATCHAQQSCMNCHAATGSWRISPHGPGFNATRAQSANPLTCRLCHRAGTIR